METRTALQRRLTREGRWAEATSFFARTVEELKVSGMRAGAAKSQAWLKMQGEFPPLLSPHDIKTMEKIRDHQPFTESIADDEPITEDEPAGPDDELPTNLPAGSGDFDADLLWAYTHLASDVQPHEAPSGSAWFLREHGRTAKTRGAFVTMCQKALSKKAGDNDERLRDDRRRSFELLKNLRVELEAAAAK